MPTPRSLCQSRSARPRAGPRAARAKAGAPAGAACCPQHYAACDRCPHPQTRPHAPPGSPRIARNGSGGEQKGERDRGGEIARCRCPSPLRPLPPPRLPPTARADTHRRCESPPFDWKNHEVREITRTTDLETPQTPCRRMVAEPPAKRLTRAHRALQQQTMLHLQHRRLLRLRCREIHRLAREPSERQWGAAATLQERICSLHRKLLAMRLLASPSRGGPCSSSGERPRSLPRRKS